MLYELLFGSIEYESDRINLKRFVTLSFLHESAEQSTGFEKSDGH